MKEDSGLVCRTGQRSVSWTLTREVVADALSAGNQEKRRIIGESRFLDGAAIQPGDD